MKLAPAGWLGHLPTSASASAASSPPADSARAAQGWLKAGFIVALVSLFVLDRFGLALSHSYSINPALFALYALVLIMVAQRETRLNTGTALAYVAVVVVTGASLVANATFDAGSQASFSSLLLLLVLYAPFMLSLSPASGTPRLWRWFMEAFIGFAIFCAVAGIVQFYTQFVYRPPWLFDFTNLIPPSIRGSGVYNITNPVGQLVKSNGFFLREASGFSFYLGFALLCELALRARKWVMALFVLGMVVSYSGSGWLALGVAMLFPLGYRTVVRVSLIVGLGAVLVLAFGDMLNLDYTLGRVDEFSASGSSAYCRFIAPGRLVAEQIDSGTWTALLGHGPGTTQRMYYDVCETTYGKVLFEYGLLGMLAFGALMLAAINRSGAPIRVRVALCVHWLLLGGHLLAPESLLLVFLVSGLWPHRAAADGVKPDASDPAARDAGPSTLILEPER